MSLNKTLGANGWEVELDPDVFNVTGQTNATTGATELMGPDGVIPTGGPSTGRKIAILGNSVVQQGASMPNASGHSAWTQLTVKTASNTIVPNQMVLTGAWAHLYYTASNSGTTGTIEPIWPDTVGQTVVDGDITWTATAVRSDYPMFGWGFWTWAQQLSGQRLQEVYINGLGGKQSNEILLYVDRALACEPDIVFFSSVFENDCWPGVAPDLLTIQARWDAAVVEFDKVRAAGKTLMLQTLLPSGNIDASSAFTGYVKGTGTKAWTWLNQKIAEYADTYPDTILWDAANVYVDANPANPVWPENTVTYLSSTGSGQQLKKTDAIHPYTSGGWLLAKSLADVITANYSPVERFSFANDSFSFAPNPLNFGTSGTAGSGITSGTPANLMSAFGYGATSAALTKVARTDKAGEWQRSTYVATAADNLTYTPSSSDTIGAHFAVGDTVQAFGEVVVEANPVLSVAPYLWLRFAGGSPQWLYSSVSPGSTAQDMGQMFTVNVSLTLKTVPMKVPASTTSLTQYAKVYGRGAANFAVQFGKMSIERVVVPDIV